MHVHVHVDTYILTYIHTYICGCMHTYISMVLASYLHSLAFMMYAHGIASEASTYIHTYIHTSIHTYIHTYVHSAIRNSADQQWCTNVSFIHIQQPCGSNAAFYATYAQNCKSKPTLKQRYLHIWGVSIHRHHTCIHTYIHTYLHADRQTGTETNNYHMYFSHWNHGRQG